MKTSASYYLIWMKVHVKNSLITMVQLTWTSDRTFFAGDSCLAVNLIFVPLWKNMGMGVSKSRGT